jgi:hypothetical protein
MEVERDEDGGFVYGRGECPLECQTCHSHVAEQDVYECDACAAVVCGTCVYVTELEAMCLCPACNEKALALGLDDFVRESNRIEGIKRVTDAEIDAHEWFLKLDELHVGYLEQFVHLVAGAPLRNRVGLDVRVGDHIPPGGGPNIVHNLEAILYAANARRGSEVHAYHLHHQYETLHPFMDGNGRSGRALWLWLMGGIKGAPLGFLHHWYYQSLRYGGPR